MKMIGKDIEKITEADLQALIDNSVLERKRSEYKQSLPSNSRSDKIEFLADVSSLANASGGDLIFGIIEDKDTGVPKTLEGVIIENIDQEILRLENMIRAGIEPRIMGVVTQPVPLSNSNTVLIVRIPKSWISPHRVSFEGHDKFYSRSTNGKYPLDVAELRVAFNLSETITERIREFREDRISKIYADESPVPLGNNAKIVLHILPVISFYPGQNYDIRSIAHDPLKLSPIYSSGIDGYRFNLDGFLTHSNNIKGKPCSYVQLFRNGIIEAVETSLLEPRGEKLEIPSIAYEQTIIHDLSEYLYFLKTLAVEPPIFVFLTMLGVKGYSMSVSSNRIGLLSHYGGHAIDRDVLLLPEIVIESYEVQAKDVLKPCFDSIWNACGFPRSLNYDKNGEWVGN
jgi:hypothetical protein